MCAEWRDSFATFLADMGPRPSGLTLERRNNDGPYSLKNCYWATRHAQNNNKRNVRRFDGKTISTLVKETGIPRHALHYRLVVLRWPLNAALAPIPPGARISKSKWLAFRQAHGI